MLACARMLSEQEEDTDAFAPKNKPSDTIALQGDQPAAEHAGQLDVRQQHRLQAGDIEGTRGAAGAVLPRAEDGWDAPAGAGPTLFGFGPHLESGLHLAARLDRVASLTKLWLAGCEGIPEELPLDLRERSPLHVAALSGATRAVRALLELGADPTSGDVTGKTPVALAATAGQVQATELLLLAAPATMEQRDKAGSPPLELAAEAGAALTVSLLLLRGADVNAQSKRGRSALHAAARAGHMQATCCARLPTPVPYSRPSICMRSGLGFCWVCEDQGNGFGSGQWQSGFGHDWCGAGRGRLPYQASFVRRWSSA